MVKLDYFSVFNISNNQNLRVSYQTGFRNPTNQDQYIGLVGSRTVLMGSSPDSVNRFNVTFDRDRNPDTTDDVEQLTGDFVFNNAISTTLLLIGEVVPVEVKNVEPEYIVSYDMSL